MGYPNGEIPYSVVSVVLDSGTDENGYWEFRCTPAFAARWAAAKRYAEAHFGRTIYVRSGWNIYRPLFSQEIARRNACASGNCNGAAVPRSSSHGGNWRGRDCLAVDVNPNGLSWAQVDAAMESAGFSAGLITESMSGIRGGEPWHYILFGDLAFGAVPPGLASSGATNFEPTTPDEAEREDDEMDILMQLDLEVSGAWYVVNYRRGTAVRQHSGFQLDRIREEIGWGDKSIRELPGPQPMTAIQGLTIVNG